MSDLERVLTYLMEQGWNPWGIDTVDIDLFSVDFKRKNIHIWYMDYSNPEKENYEQEFKSFRELVSLESGLRQFVSERKLFERNLNVWTNHGMQREYDIYDHTYWVIESALCIEEDLPEFLVNNIRVSNEW